MLLKGELVLCALENHLSWRSRVPGGTAGTPSAHRIWAGRWSLKRRTTRAAMRPECTAWSARRGREQCSPLQPTSRIMRPPRQAQPHTLMLSASSLASPGTSHQAKSWLKKQRRNTQSPPQRCSDWPESRKGKEGRAPPVPPHWAPSETWKVLVT